LGLERRSVRFWSRGPAIKRIRGCEEKDVVEKLDECRGWMEGGWWGERRCWASEGLVYLGTSSGGWECAVEDVGRYRKKRLQYILKLILRSINLIL
jgi:hypothetical protein